MVIPWGILEHHPAGGTTARLIDAMSDRCACSRQNKGRRSSNAAKPISLASVPSHHWIGVLGKEEISFFW